MVDELELSRIFEGSREELTEGRRKS